MSNDLTLPMLALIVLCILAEAVREVCFKHAAGNERFMIALAKPITWLGIGFWSVELACWITVLEHVPLSIAFPLMALSYAVIVATGAWVFKEPVTLRRAIGALLITAGATCVGATGI